MRKHARVVPPCQDMLVSYGQKFCRGIRPYSIAHICDSYLLQWLGLSLYTPATVVIWIWTRPRFPSAMYTCISRFCRLRLFGWTTLITTGPAFGPIYLICHPEGAPPLFPDGPDDRSSRNYVMYLRSLLVSLCQVPLQGTPW